MECDDNIDNVTYGYMFAFLLPWCDDKTYFIRSRWHGVLWFFSLLLQHVILFIIVPVLRLIDLADFFQDIFEDGIISYCNKDGIIGIVEWIFTMLSYALIVCFFVSNIPLLWWGGLLSLIIHSFARLIVVIKSTVEHYLEHPTTPLYAYNYDGEKGLSEFQVKEQYRIVPTDNNMQPKMGVLFEVKYPYKIRDNRN